jgi:hypothetical protein
MNTIKAIGFSFLTGVVLASLFVIANNTMVLNRRLSNIDRTFTAILAHIEEKQP